MWSEVYGSPFTLLFTTYTDIYDYLNSTLLSLGFRRIESYSLVSKLYII